MPAQNAETTKYQATKPLHLARARGKCRVACARPHSTPHHGSKKQVHRGTALLTVKLREIPLLHQTRKHPRTHCLGSVGSKNGEWEPGLYPPPSSRRERQVPCSRAGAGAQVRFNRLRVCVSGVDVGRRRAVRAKHQTEACKQHTRHARARRRGETSASAGLGACTASLPDGAGRCPAGEHGLGWLSGRNGPTRRAALARSRLRRRPSGYSGLRARVCCS